MSGLGARWQRTSFFSFCHFPVCCVCGRKPYLPWTIAMRHKGANCSHLLKLDGCVCAVILLPLCALRIVRWADSGSKRWAIFGTKSSHSSISPNQAPYVQWNFLLLFCKKKKSTKERVSLLSIPVLCLESWLESIIRRSSWRLAHKAQSAAKQARERTAGSSTTTLDLYSVQEAAAV